MEELTGKTLGQIVTRNYKAADLLEKYHLDFCCKGKRTLKQACMEQNLPVEKIQNELLAINDASYDPGNMAFENLSLAQKTEYIVSIHHEFVKRELPLIFGYLKKVAAKHGNHHPELPKVFELFSAIREEMEGHMKKEELILFPRIKELDKLANQRPAQFKPNLSYILSPVTIMQQEHEHAGSQMEEIRILTNNYTPPDDACTTYRLSYLSLQAFEADLHRHVHLENNILFPEAIEVFRKMQTSVLN